MDDIILTGNEASTIHTSITRLNKEYQITDLGRLNYFLRLEVSYNGTGLFLSQSIYAHDILARAHMLDAKPVLTPLSTLIISQVKVLLFQIQPYIDHLWELFNISLLLVLICLML